MEGWTANDIDAARRRMGTKAPVLHAKAVRRAFHKAGEMNKTEAAYAAYLDAQKKTGLIADYRFEAVKLRLADKTFYTPDFVVLAPDGTLEMHEVKGFWEEDARVKIKVAAAQFPFHFLAVKKAKNNWDIEAF